MKKLLFVLFVLLLCTLLLASCKANGNGDETTDAGTRNDETTEAPVTYDLESAKAYLKNLYKDSAVETASDYQVVSKLMIGGVAYAVEWSVNTDKVTVVAGDPYTTIDVDEKSDAVVEYVLTATIKAGDGSTVELSFNHTVPEYVLLSYEEYMAAEKDAAVVVQGVVIAVHSKEEGNKYNQLYVQDLEGKGGYYVYSMTQDPAKDLGIKAGMTVSVTGIKDIYNGLHEIKDAVVVVLDSTVKTVAPLDITELYAAASSLKDEALTSKLGMLVTIKGVLIGGQDLADSSKYYKFKLGELESYIRIYATDCPAAVTDEEQVAMAEEHATKFGWTANVTGVVVMYNGAIYLNPISGTPFEYLELQETSDEEKLEVELGNVTFSSSYGSSTELDLILQGVNYNNVVFSYTSNNAAAVVEGGKLKLTVGDTATTVEITVTATLGEKSASKVVTIKLSKDPTKIKDIDALADGTNVIVKGVVVEIKDAWNEQYGNMSVWIFDGTGKIQAYRTKTQLKVGDQITLTGAVGSYNGVKQIAQGSTAVIDLAAPSAETTIADILTTEDGVYVMFSTTVVEIKDAWNDKYGNMSVWVTDGTNRLQVYRTTTQLEVGDTVTFFGKVGSYNGAKQIAQGSYAYVTAKAPAAGESALSFADKANRTELSDTKQVWVQNGITFTNDKASSTNNVADYADPVRCYKDSTLTVAVAEGTMTKIVFECGSNDYATALGNTLGTSENYTVTVDGKVVTVELKTAAASFTTAALTAQVRISAIKVYA